jgi:hypothetical protein
VSLAKRMPVCAQLLPTERLPSSTRDLVSRFHLVGDNDDSGILCTPPIYIGFDVLQVGRRDLRARPLAERRVFLEDQLDGHTMVLPCRRLPDEPGQSSRSADTRV